MGQVRTSPSQFILTQPCFLPLHHCSFVPFGCAVLQLTLSNDLISVYDALIRSAGVVHNTYISIFQHHSPISYTLVPFSMEISPELTGNNDIASYFWVWRHQLEIPMLARGSKWSGRYFSNTHKKYAGVLPTGQSLLLPLEASIVVVFPGNGYHTYHPTPPREHHLWYMYH